MPSPSKSPSMRPVRVSEKLRQAYHWFEDSIQNLKDRVLRQKREELTSTGKRLSPEEVVELVDELEEIQRELIPREKRHEEISELLLAHWAHTGVEEIQGKLGKTLFHASFTVSIDPKVIAKGDISEGWYIAMSDRRLVAEKMLSYAQKIGQELTSLILKAARASVSVSITPPSSRRIKSGSPDEDE